MMRNKGQLIMGIGHRVKSINNPDKRVEIIKEFVMENFPATPLLQYALEVEKITTSKKPNLILNVDGVIACSFVDMLRHCGSFTRWVGCFFVTNCDYLLSFFQGGSTGIHSNRLNQFTLRLGSFYRFHWTLYGPEEAETGLV